MKKGTTTTRLISAPVKAAALIAINLGCSGVWAAVDNPVPSDSGNLDRVRQLTINCLSEPKKKVELRAHQSELQLRIENCICWTDDGSGEAQKRLEGRFNNIIKEWQNIANDVSEGMVSDAMKAISAKTNPHWVRIMAMTANPLEGTLDKHFGFTKIKLAMGETKVIKKVCYPKSIIRKINEWGSGITGFPVP